MGSCASTPPPPIHSLSRGLSVYYPPSQSLEEGRGGRGGGGGGGGGGSCVYPSSPASRHLPLRRKILERDDGASLLFVNISRFLPLSPFPPPLPAASHQPLSLAPNVPEAATDIYIYIYFLRLVIPPTLPAPHALDSTGLIIASEPRKPPLHQSLSCLH